MAHLITLKKLFHTIYRNFAFLVSDYLRLHQFASIVSNHNYSLRLDPVRSLTACVLHGKSMKTFISNLLISIKINLIVLDFYSCFMMKSFTSLYTI